VDEKSRGRLMLAKRAIVMQVEVLVLVVIREREVLESKSKRAELQSYVKEMDGHIDLITRTMDDALSCFDASSPCLAFFFGR